MANVSFPIGATNSGTNDWSDVHGEDQAIADVVNGGLDATNLASNAVTTAKITDASVTNAKLAGSITAANLAGSIGDSKLSSPNNSVYRTILNATVPVVAGTVAGTYQFTHVDTDTVGIVGVASTGAISLVSTGSDPHFAPYLYFDDADFSVGSLTQKLRVRAQIACNATAPGMTFTVGLYPLTVAGGASTLTFTLGTVVSGSTVAFASPSASTISQANSGDLTIPSDGAYAFGVVTSGTTAAGSGSLLSAQLQTRNV